MKKHILLCAFACLFILSSCIGYYDEVWHHHRGDRNESTRDLIIGDWLVFSHKNASDSTGIVGLRMKYEKDNEYTSIFNGDTIQGTYMIKGDSIVFVHGDYTGRFCIYFEDKDDHVLRRSAGSRHSKNDEVISFIRVK